MDTVKQMDAITTVIKKNKSELTDNGNKKMSDVKAQMNALDDEIKKLENVH